MDAYELQRNIEAYEDRIEELEEALRIALDSVQWMADAPDADLEDIGRLVVVTDALKGSR